MENPLSSMAGRYCQMLVRMPYDSEVTHSMTNEGLATGDDCCVRGGTADGGGSAVVITPDGFMLTSAYVVQNIQGSGLVAFVEGREHEFLVAGPIRSQTSRFLAQRRRVWSPACSAAASTSASDNSLW